MFAVRSNIKLLKFPFSFDEFNMSNNFPYVCVCVERPAPRSSSVFCGWPVSGGSLGITKTCLRAAAGWAERWRQGTMSPLHRHAHTRTAQTHARQNTSSSLSLPSQARLNCPEGGPLGSASDRITHSSCCACTQDFFKKKKKKIRIKRTMGWKISHCK